MVDVRGLCLSHQSRIQEIKEKVRLTSEELQQIDMDLEENQGKLATYRDWNHFLWDDLVPPLSSFTHPFKNSPPLDKRHTMDELKFVLKLTHSFLHYNIYTVILILSCEHHSLF